MTEVPKWTMAEPIKLKITIWGPLSLINDSSNDAVLGCNWSHTHCLSVALAVVNCTLDCTLNGALNSGLQSGKLWTDDKPCAVRHRIGQTLAVIWCSDDSGTAKVNTRRSSKTLAKKTKVNWSLFAKNSKARIISKRRFESFPHYGEAVGAFESSREKHPD